MTQPFDDDGFSACGFCGASNADAPGEDEDRLCLVCGLMVETTGKLWTWQGPPTDLQAIVEDLHRQARDKSKL